MTYCFSCELDLSERLDVDVAFWFADARCGDGHNCGCEPPCDDTCSCALAVCELCARSPERMERNRW